MIYQSNFKIQETNSTIKMNKIRTKVEFVNNIMKLKSKIRTNQMYLFKLNLVEYEKIIMSEIFLID
jgi:hypothetical protein